MAKVTRSNGDQIKKTDEYIESLLKKLEEAKQTREQLVEETVGTCTKEFSSKLSGDEDLARAVVGLNKKDCGTAFDFSIASLRVCVKIMQYGQEVNWDRMTEISNLPVEKTAPIFAKMFEGPWKISDGSSEKTTGNMSKENAGAVKTGQKNAGQKPLEKQQEVPAGKQQAAASAPSKAVKPEGQSTQASQQVHQPAGNPQAVRPAQAAAGGGNLKAQSDREKAYLAGMRDPEIEQNLQFLYSVIDRLGGSLSNYNEKTAPMFNENERKVIGRVKFILRDKGIIK